MGEIILVRHGQANSEATDEDGYDRLSELGRQQARWLGEWLADERFDRILSGTLRRQQGTAREMGHSEPEIDARLNEMDYYTLSEALRDKTGIGFPGNDAFLVHARHVMEAWEKADILGQETFESFEARVSGVLEEATEEGVRVLCVTSGGVIGMMLRHLLGLDLWRTVQIMTPIWNTSVHRIRVTPHGSILAEFNAIPHLEAKERQHARTQY